MSDASEKATRRAARETWASTTSASSEPCSSTSATASRLEAGELDAFELDDLIHRYKRSARELRKFCSRGENAVWALEDARERGEEIDWWAAGEPRRRR